MPRAAAEVTGILLEYPLMMTGCERGADLFDCFSDSRTSMSVSSQLLVVSAVF
jgi:hypothetical protein